MRGSKNTLARRARYLGGDKCLALYAKVFLIISTIYSTAFLDSGIILKELGQNLRFSVKSEVLTRGHTPSNT